MSLNPPTSHLEISAQPDDRQTQDLQFQETLHCSVLDAADPQADRKAQSLRYSSLVPEPCERGLFLRSLQLLRPDHAQPQWRTAPEFPQAFGDFRGPGCCSAQGLDRVWLEASCCRLRFRNFGAFALAFRAASPPQLWKGLRVRQVSPASQRARSRDSTMPHISSCSLRHEMHRPLRQGASAARCRIAAALSASTFRHASRNVRVTWPTLRRCAHLVEDHDGLKPWAETLGVPRARRSASRPGMVPLLRAPRPLRPSGSCPCCRSHAKV